jgi:hypothetical protein
MTEGFVLEERHNSHHSDHPTQCDEKEVLQGLMVHKSLDSC